MNDWKVLLVDDEEDFVTTLAERMELRGISTEVAFSGLEALEKLDDIKPEMVVLDLLMPGMIGLDVLRHIARTRPQTAVIVLTGHGSCDFKDEAIRLGAFECLLKPVDIDVLINKMMTALESLQSQKS
jgi:DNA-binding NtrC family response regulator